MATQSSTRKRTRRKSTLKKNSQPTHNSLNAEFKMAGEQIGLQSSSDTMSAKRSKLVRSLKTRDMVVLTNKRFGTAYRNLKPEHDELVSTSSVRSLMRGSASRSSLSGKSGATLDAFYNSLSEDRLPTHMVGFSSGKGKMQHPTAAGKGIWDSKERGNSSVHHEMDLKRKRAVAESLQEELKKGSKLTTLSSAMRKRAIAFTLNEFAAPATASDQRPDANASVSDRRLQVQARERLKAIFVALGGQQDSGSDHSLSRPWGNRSGMRSVSPPRR